MLSLDDLQTLVNQVKLSVCCAQERTDFDLLMVIVFVLACVVGFRLIEESFFWVPNLPLTIVNEFPQSLNLLGVRRVS